VCVENCHSNLNRTQMGGDLLHGTTWRSECCTID